MPHSIHITTVHSPFDIRIFHKEAKTLASAGYMVSLITQHDKDEIIDGIKIIALPKAKNRIQRMCKTSLNAFWMALKQRATVYHLHDPELLPVGLLLKLLKRKKVIYDVHEDYSKQMLYKTYIPEVLRRSNAFLIRIIEYFVSRLLDAVITATDDILNNFAHNRIAISVKNFPIVSSYCINLEKNRNDTEEFCLVYVGSLTPVRGITQIVRALESINFYGKLKLVLCGVFYPSHYELEIRALEGFKKVDYLGWVDPNSIPLLLRKSNVGIACFLPEPNHIKSMPNKLFEYMAAGLPVIASNFPLWKQIIEDNRCGICVDPLKPEEIARAITYLMNHHDLSREMAKNGRKAVLEKFNWEGESKKLIKIYEGLLR